MMVQFSDIALINIDGAIQIIDSIKDNTMFGQRQVLITTAIHNAVHTIVDFYERIDKSSLSPEEDEGSNENSCYNASNNKLRVLFHISVVFNYSIRLA